VKKKVFILATIETNSMREIQLRRLSIDNLHKRRLTLKKTLVIVSGLIVLMFAASIVMVTRQGFSLITLLPVFCMPLLVMVKRNFENVDNEIRSRYGD
jgi:1,4-dihydroxy-2-naphthoate octaprenyltransferase